MKFIKKYAVILGIILTVALVARFCGRSDETKPLKKFYQAQIDSVVKVNKQLDKDIAVIKIEKLSLKDSVIHYKQTAINAEKKQQQTVRYYTNVIRQVQNYSQAQADSFQMARYPGLPRDSVTRRVNVDLVTGDQNKDLLAQEQLKSRSLDSAFHFSQSIIEKDSVHIAKLEQKNFNNQVELINKDKKYELQKKQGKKTRSQRNWSLLGNAILTLLLIAK